MRPILALNCLLQIEQERSEEESSVGDAFVYTYDLKLKHSGPINP